MAVEKKRASKNIITIDHLALACRHVEEMKKAGLTTNFAIRLLELFVDSYARQNSACRNRYAPLHARNIDLWSKSARKMEAKNPRLKPRDYLRVEHGTPRRALAKKVLDLFTARKLSKKAVDLLVKRHWKLAVITVDEDSKLNKIARSKMFPSPEKRWAAAGIEF